MRLKKLFTSVLLVILTLAHVACSDSVDPKDKHYEQALEYIKVDDDESAIIELRNAIQIDAKFADARYQLGLLYLKQGNPQAAFEELQRSFGLDGNKLDAGVKVAEFYLLSRDKEQTRKLIDQVLNVDPEYPDALALLANLELIEGNYQQAKTAVDKALSKNAKNDKLYNIKGRVLTALGQADQAEKDFRKAIELNPEVFTNYRTLLMLYEQEKNEVAVQQLLAEMISKFPKDPQLHVLLAGIHLKKGEKDEAEQEMIKAADTRKDVVSYRLMLADFYKKHNQFDKAENVLREAQKEFANEVQVKTALAEILFEKSFFPEAKELINGVLNSNPTNGAANLIKARFMIRDGRNQEALELLTPLMTDYPKWADPFYYGALTYLRLGTPELAQKSIELALHSSPGNDRFHALAAQIHLMRGNSQEATREASIALRHNPRNGIAIKILAKSLVQAKQFEKAVELVENLPPEAVNSDPELLESLSMGYLGLNDKENATKSLEKLLELTPEDGNILAVLTALANGDNIQQSIIFVQKHLAEHQSGSNYLLLGDLQIKNKQYEEALQSFSKVQELNPDNPQGYIKSAQLLSDLGKTDETIKQFESLLRTNPKSIPGLMGLAAMYQTIGQIAQAKAKYEEVLKIAPDQPLAANNLAWLLASEENGDLGEALRLAMQAKQSLPNSANIADTLGWVHYQRKSYSLAIPQFQQALQFQPLNATIQYHLALAQWENGEQSAALDSLKEALQKSSDELEKKEMKVTLENWQAIKD